MVRERYGVRLTGEQRDHLPTAQRVPMDPLAERNRDGGPPILYEASQRKATVLNVKTQV